MKGVEVESQGAGERTPDDSPADIIHSADLEVTRIVLDELVTAVRLVHTDNLRTSKSVPAETE